MKYFEFPLFLLLFFFLNGTFFDEKTNYLIFLVSKLQEFAHWSNRPEKASLKSKQAKSSEVRYQKYVAFLCGFLFYASKKLLFPFHFFI